MADIEYTGDEEGVDIEEPTPDDLAAVELESTPDIDINELKTIQDSRKELEQKSMDLIDRLVNVSNDGNIQDKDAMRKTIKGEIAIVGKQIKELNDAESVVIKRISQKSDEKEPRSAAGVENEEDIPEISSKYIRNRERESIQNQREIAPRSRFKVEPEDESEFANPEDFEENYNYILDELEIK